MLIGNLLNGRLHITIIHPRLIVSTRIWAVLQGDFFLPLYGISHCYWKRIVVNTFSTICYRTRFVILFYYNNHHHRVAHIFPRTLK